MGWQIHCYVHVNTNEPLGPTKGGELLDHLSNLSAFQRLDTMASFSLKTPPTNGWKRNSRMLVICIHLFRNIIYCCNSSVFWWIKYECCFKSVLQTYTVVCHKLCLCLWQNNHCPSDLSLHVQALGMWVELFPSTVLNKYVGLEMTALTAQVKLSS